VVAFLDPERLLTQKRLGTLVSGAQELRDAIATLTGDPREWEQASARGRRYIDERGGESEMVSAYVAALSSLLAAPPIAAISNV
jgi:hypothetical protein